MRVPTSPTQSGRLRVATQRSGARWLSVSAVDIGHQRPRAADAAHPAKAMTLVEPQRRVVGLDAERELGDSGRGGVCEQSLQQARAEPAAAQRGTHRDAELRNL